MKSFWFIVYNVLVLPLMILASNILSLFNRKIKTGLAGRKAVLRRVEKFVALRGKQTPLILFHCASMGEYEQIKPILSALSAKKAELVKVVCFFSPSGYENAGENPDVDLKIYAPLDSLRTVRKFLNFLQPAVYVISKHDVWPNLIWSLSDRKIPVILINGTMPTDSFMTKPLVRHFYRTVFTCFRFIAPASEADRTGFVKIVKRHVPLKVMGDTRFDQVLVRSLENKKKEIIPRHLFENRLTIIAGSVWPSDEEHLFPALLKLLNEDATLLLIIVPHEPGEQHVRQIKKYFADHQHSSFLFSEGNFVENFVRYRILIVNRIGVLANLYGYCDIAYVGGSFDPGVHNVMEPAAFHLPVLFGPKILNSPEAFELERREAGFKIENRQEAYSVLKKLCREPDYRKSCGERAFALIDENSGVTQKIADKILVLLQNKKQ